MAEGKKDPPGGLPLPVVKIRTIDCKQGAVRAVRFNVDGSYCMSCGSDKSLKLWNPHRGTLLQTYSGHGYEVLDAQGSCDNARMVSGGSDKAVFLWDVATARAVRKFRGHAGRVNAVKFDEASTAVLSASVDGTVRIWDCRSRDRDPFQILSEAKDGVSSLGVSSYEILTGSLDGHVRRYDLRRGEMCSDCLGKPVTSVCFTRDGQCILASRSSSSLALLDKDTGQLLSEYAGHSNDKYHLDCCLSADDANILSGSEDGYVYVWDLVQGSTVAKLEHGGRAPVHSLSYHPTKARLLTAAGGHAHLWGDVVPEDQTATERSP